MKYGDAVVYGVGADAVFALVVGSRMVAPAEHGVTLVDGDGDPLPAEEHVDLLYLDPSIGEVKYAGNDDYVRRAFGVRAATLTRVYTIMPNSFISSAPACAPDPAGGDAQYPDAQPEATVSVHGDQRGVEEFDAQDASQSDAQIQAAKDQAAKQAAAEPQEPEAQSGAQKQAAAEPQEPEAQSGAQDQAAAAEDTQDASQSDTQDQACATQQEAPQSSEQ